jgi:uncharacterized coiled-coil protein SlyX
VTGHFKQRVETSVRFKGPMKQSRPNNFEQPAVLQSLSANVLDKRARRLRSSAPMKRTILPLTNSINRSPVRRRFFLIPLGLACFALSPQARAVCQEGCDSSLFNAFLGDDALISNATGAGNTAVGWRSLFSNTDGSFNTGLGSGALVSNTGSSNTAVGAAALLRNTIGTGNTAVGTDAMAFNNTGISNTAVGAFALLENTDGQSNTALGRRALEMHTIGNDNTAVGVLALESNVSGEDNTALGSLAGVNINGSGNVCIGQGVSGEVGVNDSTYIRNVNTTEQSPAEDVAFVTVRLSDGRLGHQPITMRSASSELQKTADELKSTVARQEATIARQQKQIEALTAGLQKVSAQLEMSKPAPQTVLNDH